MNEPLIVPSHYVHSLTLPEYMRPRKCIECGRHNYTTLANYWEPPPPHAKGVWCNTCKLRLFRELATEERDNHRPIAASA